MKKSFRTSNSAWLLCVLLFLITSSIHAATAADSYQAGVSFYQQGQYDQCIEQENIAIDLSPRFWQAYQVKGYAYFKEHNFVEALNAYRKCLQVNPYNPQLQSIVDQLEQTPTAVPTPVVTTSAHDVSHHHDSPELEAPLNNTKSTTIDHPATNNEVVGGQIITQIAGGLLVPVSDQAASDFNAGYSLNVMLGYCFDAHFVLGLQVTDNELTYNTAKILEGLSSTYNIATFPVYTHIPVEVVGQYNLGDELVKPYFLLGCGLAFDSVHGTELITGNAENGFPVFGQTYNNNWRNLEIEPGIGISFTLDKRSNFFIQTKLDMDFGPTVSTPSTPAESTDNPILTIPLEVGFNSTFE